MRVLLSIKCTSRSTDYYKDVLHHMHKLAKKTGCCVETEHDGEHFMIWPDDFIEQQIKMYGKALVDAGKL